MRIRNGSDADAAAAAALVQRVLHEHGLPFEPRGLDADILAPDAHYGAGGGAFFVAVDPADRVVGTAGLLRTGPASGEVRKMFLLPEARGQGVGRALLDAVLDAARTRGLERLTLTTRHRYDRAIRLYERAGFRAAGSAQEPRAGDPGLTYALRLAPEGDRAPSRPADGRRRLVLIPSFA
ncbi:MAG TPA: GNAT family N-acetyltransferase [Actinomycetota bacterium]|nr:GNAT family N-acetyltransferase [Actinomycetota bacterium]